MYDFVIGLFESIVKHGLSWSTAGAVLFLILKQRAMKRKLNQYLPFIFKDEEVNQTYVSNQKIIMENQLRIMEGMGIEPCDIKPTAALQKKSTQTSLRPLSKLLWEKMKGRIKKMSNINKGILLPLLSAIALFVKEAFGYEISTELIDMAANIILYLIFMLGLFMNFTKKKKTPKQKEVEHDGLDFTQDGSL